MRIGDFFYNLKKQARDAKAPLDLVCTILIGQLPKQVQSKAKTFYADKRQGDSTVLEADARLLMVDIKEQMTSRGIPLDVGCTHRDELSPGKTLDPLQAVRWVDAPEVPSQGIGDNEDKIAAVNRGPDTWRKRERKVLKWKRSLCSRMHVTILSKLWKMGPWEEQVHTKED